MEKDLKDILLNDLCARLPYGVKFPNAERSETVLFIDTSDNEVWINGTNINDVKPYLFPLSSMTEEIEDEIYAETGLYDIFENDQIHISVGTNFLDVCKLFNILNKYHLDYNGLIPMNLAIDATGLNIY